VGEYEGKERIITQSYKRKLEEREHWAKEEAERTRLEEIRDRQLKESCNKGGYMTNSLMLGIVGRNLLTMDNSKNYEQCTTTTTTTTTDRNQGVEREQESVVRVTHDRNCTTTTVNYSNSSSHRPTATQLQTHPALSSSSSSVPAIASATVNGTLGQMKTREDKINNVTSSTLKEEKTTTTMMHNNKSRQEIVEERAIKLYNARKRYYERREKEKRVGST
jgi:hypothetical protein